MYGLAAQVATARDLSQYGHLDVNLLIMAYVTGFLRIVSLSTTNKAKAGDTGTI